MNNQQIRDYEPTFPISYVAPETRFLSRANQREFFEGYTCSEIRHHQSIEGRVIQALNVMHRLAEAYPSLHATVRTAVTERIMDNDMYDLLYYQKPQSKEFYAIVDPLLIEEQDTERSPMHIFSNFSNSSDTFHHLIAPYYNQLQEKIGEQRTRGRGFFSAEEYGVKVKEAAYIVYKNTTKEVTAQDAFIAAAYLVNLNLAKDLERITTAGEQKEYLQEVILNNVPQLRLPFSETRAA